MNPWITLWITRLAADWPHTSACDLYPLCWIFLKLSIIPGVEFWDRIGRLPGRNLWYFTSAIYLLNFLNVRQFDESPDTSWWLPLLYKQSPRVKKKRRGKYYYLDRGAVLPTTTEVIPVIAIEFSPKYRLFWSWIYTIWRYHNGRHKKLWLSGKLKLLSQSDYLMTENHFGGHRSSCCWSGTPAWGSHAVFCDSVRIRSPPHSSLRLESTLRSAQLNWTANAWSFKYGILQVRSGFELSQLRITEAPWEYSLYMMSRMNAHSKVRFFRCQIVIDADCWCDLVQIYVRGFQMWSNMQVKEYTKSSLVTSATGKKSEPSPQNKANNSLMS